MSVSTAGTQGRQTGGPHRTMGLEVIQVVPWKEFRKDHTIMTTKAAEMFNEDDIGYNNFANEHCKQRIIPIFKIEDLDKIQEKLLSKPLLLKAVVVQETPKKASLLHQIHCVIHDFALLINTRDSNFSKELDKIFKDMKAKMAKGKVRFCAPIDVNSVFNTWFKNIYLKQNSFHDLSMEMCTFGAVIYITNVTEAAEGGRAMTRILRCGVCSCVHDD